MGNLRSEIFRSGCLRALGQVDINPTSPTYGCADRAYWHYQDTKGFDVASPLAAISALHTASSYFAVEGSAFRQATEAMLNWWARCVIGRQSLNEYFRGQDSFCALAHTTLSAALATLNESRSSKVIDSLVLEGLKVARNKLVSARNFPQSANQVLAASIAIDILDFELPQTTRNSLTDLPIPFDRHDGYYLEYGGFDLGYTLLCVDLVVEALLVSRHPTLQSKYMQHLGQLLVSLKLFVHEFTFTPELSSRGNPHKLVGGLRCLANSGDELAQVLIDDLDQGKRFSSMVTAQETDDKYLMFFHLTSLSLEFCSPDLKSKLFTNTIALDQPRTEATLRLKRYFFLKTPTFKLTTALCNGGMTFIESKTNKLLIGANLVVANGRVFTTAEGSADVTVNASTTACTIKSMIRCRPVNFHVKLSQSWHFGMLLRTCMMVPILRKLTRYLIYQCEFKRSKLTCIGERTIKIAPHGAISEELFFIPIDQILSYKNWSMRDAHATRLHGHAEVGFAKVASGIAANGKLITARLEF